MAVPSLQDGIDQAGSPVALLWKPGSAPWTPEVIEPEYAGWRQEQASTPAPPTGRPADRVPPPAAAPKSGASAAASATCLCRR
jgi:hypothetical protein